MTGELPLPGAELGLAVTPAQLVWPMIPNNRAMIARVGTARAATLRIDF